MAENNRLLAEVRDESAAAVRWLNEALDAAKTIRDRSAAAYTRGLRDDDTEAINSAQVTITAALAMLEGAGGINDNLKDKVTGLLAESPVCFRRRRS
jgi:hypothetical protein